MATLWLRDIPDQGFIKYEDMPQSLCTPLLFRSLRTLMLFDDWLIDAWTLLVVFLRCFSKTILDSVFPYIFYEGWLLWADNRQELAEFGWFVSGKYRLLKCADFAAHPRQCPSMLKLVSLEDKIKLSTFHFQNWLFALLRPLQTHDSMRYWRSQSTRPFSAFWTCS